MKVDPGYVNHPKFLRLKKAVGDFAMEAVVRVWGHCQQGQKGEYWRGADAGYVEAVAMWAGEDGKLFEALSASRIIIVEERGIRVNDWNQHNSLIIQCWKKGVTGGRPAANQQRTQGLPTAKPELSQREPVCKSVSKSVGSTDLNKGTAANGLTKTQLDALKVQWSALNAQVAELERKKGQEGLTGPEREELREKKAARDAVQKKQAEGKFE